MNARYIVVTLGRDAYAVMDRDSGHFAEHSTYGIREMADARADRLNRK